MISRWSSWVSAGTLAGARAAAVAALAGALAWPAASWAQAPYASPEQAADALIAAVATNDPDAMARVMGKDWRTLFPPELTREDVWVFLEKASRSRTVKVDGSRAALVVGTDPYTLPVPIVQGKDGQWRFDPVAGRESLQDRRIGLNELSAMQAMLAYLDAQYEYALVDRDGNGVLEYAQKLLSSPGKRDGLIWSPALGDESPLGEAFLPARPGAGYHGYRFRILTGQGPQAPGGARSYLIGQRMTRGYALLAWPVQYGVTGVMSFQVNHAGVIYERDLGPRTAQAAARITVFNPDDTWKPAKPVQP
jgi:hypothetical protein